MKSWVYKLFLLPVLTLRWCWDLLDMQWSWVHEGAAALVNRLSTRWMAVKSAWAVGIRVFFKRFTQYFDIDRLLLHLEILRMRFPWFVIQLAQQGARVFYINTQTSAMSWTFQDALQDGMGRYHFERMTNEGATRAWRLPAKFLVA